ncbi:Helicase conserved C-terminal domain containing protein [Trichomonas vaginalis G3]|uniref:Helicase conserved C-terminal domain containing protein n=1 Tax=Trichomonas vaginalis (strain ATCC PRA-98 / G3) TaxID=412133 RepID=A2G5F5_TRIV3|nr:helicase [Trichomonas vaginalis G3]EAX87614.1 Helicase conserved C-terminal domain containing protein [Trichomonas vaginalis G3]KAI5496218.1 hypothetical protein TVAGG3_0796630 [Trichomonas vaginalis G3]|eukprot:XP_001300544.1 helicase [Trichomonas vaginalis G3]
MSGTLPTWMVERLWKTYPTLFNSVLSIEGDNNESINKEIFLPEMPTVEYYPFIKEMIISLLDERTNGYKHLSEHFDENHPKRAIIFMDTVAHAEELYIYLSYYINQKAFTDKFVHPKIRFATPKKTLFKNLHNLKLQIKAKNGEDLSKMVEKMEKLGIYIHHAQLKGEISNPNGWKDVIEYQISSCNPNADFVAIICTSTLSVGINLAPSQIAFLAPNSLWTIEQAKQMVGRVGRDPKDKSISLAMIVDSPLYSAPCMTSLTVPNSWFIPRLISAIDFNIGIDVRGFFVPRTAAPIEFSDIPGNGLIDLAQEIGLVDGLKLNNLARAALCLCKYDSKSLPSTYSFLSYFQQTSAFQNEENEDKWIVVLLWAMLISKFPNKWEKLDCNELIPCVFSSNDLKYSKIIVKQYGETHSKYPGDLTIPSDSNFKKVISYFNTIILSIGLSASIYTTVASENEKSDSIIDLMMIIMTLSDFINGILEDINALFHACNITGTNIHLVVKSIESASNFLTKCRNFGMMEGIEFPILNMNLDEDIMEKIKKFSSNYDPYHQYRDFSLVLQ